MPRRWAAAVAALALLAACSRADQAPGGLSADDERRLNEAADMLDVNAVDANAVELESADGNGTAE